MIDSIKRYFGLINVKNFRIIEHNIIEYTIIQKDDHKTKTEKSIYFVIIIFENEDRIYKIEIPSCDNETLFDILNQIIKDKLSWVSYSINLEAQLTAKNNEILGQYKSIAEYEKEINYYLSEFLNRKRYTLIAMNSKYIRHISKVYFSNAHCEQNYNEHSLELHICNNKKEESYLLGSNNILEELLKEINSPSIAPSIEIQKYEDFKGNVLMPTTIMETIFLVLTFALNGHLISAGRSFIKSEHFMQPIASSYFTMVDDPSCSMYKNSEFDAEGSLLTKKYLIKNGILTDCLNDIESAFALKLKPGNAFINYNNRHVQIAASTIFIKVDKIMNIEDVDIVVEGVYNQQISIDIMTGNLNFLLYGRDKRQEERRIYRMDTNIIELMQKIIGAYGDLSSNARYVMPNIVIHI